MIIQPARTNGAEGKCFIPHAVHEAGVDSFVDTDQFSPRLLKNPLRASPVAEFHCPCLSFVLKLETHKLTQVFRSISE